MASTAAAAAHWSHPYIHHCCLPTLPVQHDATFCSTST